MPDVDPVAALERGRDLFASEAWGDAYESLRAADASRGLGAEDLDRMATAAYMVGREDSYLGLLERAYRSHLDAGEPLAALRSAFWIGVNLARRGELGGAGGWLGRAGRLLEREGEDRVERGYLLLPSVFELSARGQAEEAAATAGEAAAIGERFGDQDLFALAAHEQGHILIRHGSLREGLQLLDEAMVAVTAGELSPIVCGIVYCGVILACREAHEVRRAKEWTTALTSWCERQPDLVAFTGRCLVHRAEILQLEGDWAEALEETRRADARCRRAENADAAGEASYRRGEILRLRGEEDAAEEAYRQASGYGREPQPGLALLRLAQGNIDSARAAIRRISDDTTQAGERVGFLPALVEISLAAGDLEPARSACEELERIAADDEAGALGASAAHARSTLELTEGRPREALASARRAEQAWHYLDAPFETARARVVAGLACGELGDRDAEELELDAARATFRELGAAHHLAQVRALVSGRAPDDSHGLTDRELEVLRHLSAGATNKQIAAELVLSTRTVDRHVSNIFGKLRVSTRAAATTFAHEHELV